MLRTIPLSTAKARLSEVIREVRRTGEAILISVDGVTAARVAPVRERAVPPTPAEVAAANALYQALLHMPRAEGSFDATALVHEGRR